MNKEQKWCYDCTMNGIICVRDFDDDGKACDRHKARERCPDCNAMLVCNEKIDFYKSNYCWKCEKVIE